MSSIGLSLAVHQLDAVPAGRTGVPSELAAEMHAFIATEVKRLQRPDDVLVGVTFQFNTPARGGRVDPGISDADRAPYLFDFSAEMDSKVLSFGPRFRRMRARRPWFIVCGQPGDGGHLHYHGIVGVTADKAERFQLHAEHVWRRVTRGGGSLHIDDQINGGWLNYITRHLIHAHESALHIVPDQRRPH